MSQSLSEIFRVTKPIEDMEAALVGHCADSSKEKPLEETVSTVRYALNLAKLTHLPLPEGKVINLSDQLDKFRTQVRELLSPMIGEAGAEVDFRGLDRIRLQIKQLVHAERATLLRNNVNRFNKEILDREVCNKSLVLVLGGGGGVGYIYLGAFKALEDAGIKPSYIVGTSMGAILGLFRARNYDFRWGDVVKTGKVLQWKTLISFISMKNRFGLPAYMRLHLYSAFAEFFKKPSGEDLTLRDMAIPFDVIVAGIRKGKLKHPPDYYEKMLDSLYASGGGANIPLRKARGIMREMLTVIGEFFSNSNVLTELVMGSDPDTLDVKALDAVGFSSALPAVLHYDINRDDPQSTALFDKIMESRDVLRLIDGGMIDNVPARVAWEGVFKGRIPKRNSFVLTFDAFAPRPLAQPLWLPLQRLAAQQSRRNKPFAHYWHNFLNTLSPLDIVPDMESLRKVIDIGYAEVAELSPFLKQMMEPLPGLEGEYVKQNRLVGV